MKPALDYMHFAQKMNRSVHTTLEKHGKGKSLLGEIYVFEKVREVVDTFIISDYRQHLIKILHDDFGCD